MDKRETLFRNRVRHLIQVGGPAGLPVRFLEYVMRKYGLQLDSRKKDFATDYDNNKLLLSHPLGARIGKAAFDGDLTEARAIGILYHEATHAYMDLKLEEADPEVKRLVNAAKQYYRGGSLVGGRRVTDPERVADEAICEYVHRRVYNWWIVRDLLEAGKNLRPDYRRMAVAPLRISYNMAGRQRAYGYEEFSENKTLKTKKPIMPSLARYADVHLLEGKIPLVFSAVPGFRP